MISATIFGSGIMGGAIGDLLSAAGSSVQHVDKAEEATITGDVVVLAVPYEALHDIVEQYGQQLRGRIVVDITNPVDFETFDALKVPAGSSASAELQAALPDGRVLKAFNTNFAATLSAKQVGPNTTTVLVSGDENPFAESFNARVRDELLNMEEFSCLAEAQVLTEDWRQDYNREHPHSGLGMKSPSAFAAAWASIAA